MVDKGFSDEANELKFYQYVTRVNESVKAIVDERKKLAKKDYANTLSVDEVIISAGRP